MKILFLISVLCAPVIALSTAQCVAGFVINCLFYCYDFSGRTLMAQTYPNTDDFQTTPLTLDNLAVLCPNTIRSIQIYDECTLDTCDTRQIAINTPIYTKRTAFFEQFCVKCTCKEKNTHTPGPITWDGYYCCSGDDYSAKGNEFYSFQNKCLYDTSPLLTYRKLDLDLTEINRFIHLFRIIRRQCVSPYTTRPWHPRFVTDYPHFTQWDGAKSALQHQLYHSGLTAEDMNPLNSLPSVLT
eukprot:13097_1